ncbi:MAG: primosomal protein [Candidatus Bathyarchaeota archaeon B24]|nr:MAG: primosomal protein [Candidatus Bathyarchaeota archaeon B24]
MEWSPEVPERVRGRRLPSVLTKLIVIVVVLAIVVAVSLPMCVCWLSPGEVAVTYDPVFRSYGGPYVGPTMFLKAPWQGLIKDFYTIDYIDMTSEVGADYPPITALTKDGVEITVDESFTYSIDPERFLDLVKNYPRIDYEEQVLVPIMRQVVRDIVSDYTVEQVISNREEVASKIEVAYRSRIEADPTLSAIKLHAVMLRGIRLPSRIKDAIEAKIAAYQQKIAAEYERERILTLANASAMEKIIMAEGEAEAIKLRAEAIRSALMSIYNATGDPEVLRIYVLMEQLQRMEKPVIIIGGGGLTPLIQIPQSESED